MNKLKLTTILLCLNIFAMAQPKTAFQIFDTKGKKVSYEKMFKSLVESDMVLFGELHNNPIAHWLQYELTTDLTKKRSLILGAEMFESDNQFVVNQYLNGEIDDKGLDTLARLWKNYKTDYAPLLTIAKEDSLAFIASNIPRSYASMVYKGGFEALDSLSIEEKSWIAPLPITYDAELECYKNILKMAHGHGGANLPKAQAIKDATMAYFILDNYKKNSLFIHFHGAYHSQNYQGILWYLKLDQPSMNYKTITTVLQENPTQLEEEHKNSADFIIVVDKQMTTTY